MLFSASDDQCTTTWWPNRTSQQPTSSLWRHWQCLYHGWVHGENLHTCWSRVWWTWGIGAHFQEGTLWTTILESRIPDTLCRLSTLSRIFSYALQPCRLDAQREEEDGYDYICTHVDDFKIVTRDPERRKARTSGTFLLKFIGPPVRPIIWVTTITIQRRNLHGWWVEQHTWKNVCVASNLIRISSKMNFSPNAPLYLKDATLNLMIAICYRSWESGNIICWSEWLSSGRLQLGVLTWLLLRSRCPVDSRQLLLAYYLFGNLKKHPNHRIVVDSRPLLVDDDLHSIQISWKTTRTQTKMWQRISRLRLDVNWIHQYFLMEITPMTMLLGNPYLVLLFLWAAPLFCGRVSDKDALLRSHIVHSLFRCVPLWKRPFWSDACYDVWEYQWHTSAEIPEDELKKKYIAISYISLCAWSYRGTDR